MATIVFPGPAARRLPVSVRQTLVRLDALARRHAQRAVEADDLAVEHRVLDDVRGERRVLLGRAEPVRMRELARSRAAGSVIPTIPPLEAE